jgi:hypothetical protein
MHHNRHPPLFTSLGVPWFLDTVVEGQSRVFFDAPEPAAIEETVRALLARDWDAEPIKAYSARFSEAAFAQTVLETVAEVVETREPSLRRRTPHSDGT